MDAVLIVVFCLLAVLLAIGVNIGPSIGLAVMAGLFLGDMSFALFAQKMFTTFESFPLLAVPFFIMSGEIMQRGTMSSSLIEFSKSMVGHLRGSLSQISILTSLFYGALCGSAPATTAAVGGMLIPAMEDDGYPKPYATGVNVAAGCLGVMIPPSVPLILYGSTAGVSISDLFIATIVPGCVVGLALLVASYIICVRRGYGRCAPRMRAAERLKAMWNARYAIMVPVIVLGGIYGGITTPTEAGVVAVVYALLVETFITKNMTLAVFHKVIISTLKTMGAIFLIVAVANGLAQLLLYYDAQELVKT